MELEDKMKPKQHKQCAYCLKIYAQKYETNKEFLHRKTCGKKPCIAKAKSGGKRLKRGAEGDYGFYLRDLGWKFVDD